MSPSPDSVSSWINVIKDFLLLAIGVFIIIHETLGLEPPSVLLLLVAAAALGLPIADKIAVFRRKE